MSTQPPLVLELFRETGAYLNGHFRLTSGLHSPEYLQCALVLQHPSHAERLGSQLAGVLRQYGVPSAVIAPALGGLIIGHEVARAFGVRFLFTERDAEGRMTLRRGFSIEPAEKVVVVEDVITTGGSTREVVDIVKCAGGVPVAAGSIIDRSGGAADVGAPRAALVTLQVTAWKPEECPLCRDGQPVVKPGSRK